MNIVIRTPQAIQQRIRERMQYDLFGFELNNYLSCLGFEDAKEFLKPEATAADWLDEPQTLNAIDKEAKEYLAFWLEKIEGERGLSVCRATSHYIAWKWLLGHSDADTFPGSIHGSDGGWYQRKAYTYIQDQIVSGEWDQMSERAIAVAEATNVEVR